ncbi:MAG: hypothetical protein IKO53_08950 [Lachnospiraceae bacterium]|nr:hypothetical protein [Lachnospiraceae bacterium]
MGRKAQPLSEASKYLANEIGIYTQEVAQRADKAAKKVRNEMRKELLGSITPYREYDLTGSGDRVAREIAETKGHLRDGWVSGTIKSKKKGSIILKQDSMYYAVRSKNKPALVHLLNFPHRIVLWGRPTNRKTNPKPFVDEVSEKGYQELEKELEKIGLKKE